jgi:hypothetical protein
MVRVQGCGYIPQCNPKEGGTPSNSGMHPEELSAPHEGVDPMNNP